MKKHALIFVAMLGLLATVAVTPVSGQTRVVMTADIPFDFTIGQTTLPAGKYSVCDTGISGTLAVRDEDGRTKVMFSAIYVAPQDSPANAGLQFHRYGDRYFLSKLWAPGASGRELPPSRAERELSSQLAQNTAQPGKVYIAAR